MKVGEHEKRQGAKASPCENPVALMITHDRPGLLLATVGSFWKTTSCVPLNIFDDGSTHRDKAAELELVRGTGAVIHKLPAMGFARVWQHAFLFAKEHLRAFDSVIMLEDDIVFAKGWLETLQAMQKGIVGLGLGQGMTSCFRPHEEPQNPVVELCGIEAYQSMAHTFHVNMMPMDVLRDFSVVEESVSEVINTRRGLGLDVYLVGNLAHRLNRQSFVAMQSWAAHLGLESIVEGQGFGKCGHPGFNLVAELEKFAEGWKK